MNMEAGTMNGGSSPCPKQLFERHKMKILYQMSVVRRIESYSSASSDGKEKI